MEIILALMLIVPLVNAQCYTCSDTGKIICNNCQGSGRIPTGEPIETCEYCRGLGFIQPTISKKSGFAQIGNREVFVSGTFENDQAVGVYAVATAEVFGDASTYSSTSDSTYFPPNEEIVVTIVVTDIPLSDWNEISKFGNLQTNIYISESDSLVCPLCDGEGIITQKIACSYCDGIGFVDCPDCSLNLGLGDESGITIIGIVAIIGLALGSFVLIKRKQTSESDLRKVSFYEFQNWVVEKFSGKSSSIRDSRIGIDGYTLDGEPIQIKQSDSIGKNEVYKFANELSKKKSRYGIIVAFSFKDDVFEGIIGAKQHYRLEIKPLTVKELIQGKNFSP
jgi:RecJ-like exonuclease